MLKKTVLTFAFLTILTTFYGFNAQFSAPATDDALNALAACAVAWKFSILGETTAAALASFHGAGRRLEYKGSFRGADIYDDYAHHPGELHALLSAAREYLPNAELRGVE